MHIVYNAWITEHSFYSETCRDGKVANKRYLTPFLYSSDTVENEFDVMGLLLMIGGVLGPEGQISGENTLHLET